MPDRFLFSISRFIVSFAIALASIVSVQADDNLLARPDLVFLPDHSSGLGLDSSLKIKDENLDTSATITLSSGAQTEMVYSFSESTVTPTALGIVVSGLKANQASVEILVSEDGPDTGYLSLRTEPLRASEQWQRIKFEPAAAKWLMVKITPYGESAEFELKEIEILGYEGPPVSLYAFDEAPSQAIDVLNSLEQIDLAFDIHPDEIALLEDAQDGSLDSWSFAEASLISSGVVDANQRAKLLEQLDELTEQARTAVAAETGAFDKGRVLLEWLHERSMNEGYVEAQTDMSEVLNKQHYNCVSSATLYNIVGKRLGLDARGIEVPDHAFTILYDGTNHVDVETTTPHGFDPARDRAAMNAFARTTGYTYINDKDRAKRREINDAGMVALTYYNHGVKATEEDDFAAALLYYFRALSLDPKNKSAIKNTLVVLSRWSHQEIDNENYGAAVNILNAALQFAPGDNTSRHNMRYALSKAMLASSSADEMAEHVAFAQELYARTEDKTFLRLQSRVLQNKAHDFYKQGQFEEAIALTETLDANTDDTTRRDIDRMRMSLFLNWSNSALEKGDHTLAMDVLERAYNERPSDHRVKNNIAFTAQEWAASVTATDGAARSRELLSELAARFPEISNLRRLSASNYNSDAKAALDAGDYEGAIAVYQTAQKLGVTDSVITKNEKVVWNQWGLSLVEQGDYSGALTVFEKALTAHPKHSNFTKNVIYAVQEWSRSVYEKGNVLDAERTVQVQRMRFPEIRNIAKLQGNFIGSEVNAATTSKEFEALAPTLKSISGYIEKKSVLDNLVGVFYQNWAKAIDPALAKEDVLPVMQSGVTDFPENRHLIKLYVHVIDRLGGEAMANADWERALSIYQSASRSLPAERSFERKLTKIREQI